MSKLLLKSVSVLLLFFFFSWAYLFMPQVFFSLNDHLRDLLFNMRKELPQTDNIVIVDIDEKSLAVFGQWPWSRDRIALMLKNLNSAKVGIVGLDIVFSEKDKTSPRHIANKLKLPDDMLEDYDITLSKTFASTPTVGGYIFNFNQITSNITPHIPAIFLERGLKDNTSILTPDGTTLNIEILQDSLYSSGFFNNTPDVGGVIRRIPLVMRYQGIIFPSLVLEMVRIYSGIENVELFGDTVGLKEINFGDFQIPIDHAGRMIVNFRGKRKHFKYISAKDIIENTFDKKNIAGKFVLIGTSAVGLSDLRATPLDSTMPGVEVHANALDNILNGDYMYEPADVVVYDLLIIFVLIIFLMLLFSLVSSWLLLPLAIAVLYGMYEISFYILFNLGMLLNLLFPLFAFFLTFIISVSIDYMVEARQREKVKAMFAKKVSKAVMEDIISYGKEDVLKARNESVAVFFSDIRGFTQISESIGSSEKLIRLLNRYMTPVTDEISKHEGTVDKFIGDAIMAYWNAPKAVDKYSDKAVTSALKQIEILDNLNDELYEEFGVRLKIGIGIHTGIVTVGEMGSTGRSDYTIIGDNVNLASRLEGLTKVYGVNIIISLDTKNKLENMYHLRTLDMVRVKGKIQVIEIFEVYNKDKYTKEEEKLYFEAMTVYRQGNIVKAYQLFIKLEELYSHILYKLYIERCVYYKENSDIPFDVVYTMRHK